LEKDGVIPLPQLELGVIVRPFFRNKNPAANEIQEIAFYEKLQEEEFNNTKTEEEIEIIEEIIIEKEIVVKQFLVLFNPNTAVPARAGTASLNEAIAALNDYKDFEEYKITLRGYSAPYGASPGQIELSRQRVLYCISQITAKHSSSGLLINVEWYGADSVPENTQETDHSLRRSVEIIIEGWRYP
jgi:outer membrane protein OmpA-like peptidoglycan-associated protein